MSEYLSKEEIKKWRSSVEKITLEEYAARLGKKLQEEKKTNDLADMLYTHYNPADSSGYDTVTKLEKIDLTPKISVKPKKVQKEDALVNDKFDVTEDDIALEEDTKIEDAPKPSKTEKTIVKKAEPKTSKKAEAKTVSEPEKKQPKTTTKKEAKVEKPVEKKPSEKVKKEKAAKTEKQEEKKVDAVSLNITFTKPLTDREEKVLAYFLEKKGEIVFAKDLAELLDLKRDYIYKYIKNLRAKMSTDIIVNADNGGFKID